MRGASALDVAIRLRQWAVDERSFGQSIEYSGEGPPGAREVLALERKTYQSSDKLAAAARRARVKLDLVIFDEAHRTIGDRSRAFATLLEQMPLGLNRRDSQPLVNERVCPP
jgi:superfamily II DNA or RNA helicase